MGLDDLINKAKDLMGEGSEKAHQAADSAAEGDTTAAANEAAESAGLIDKAKALLSDERIDQVADAIKDKTPDQVDSVIDSVAGKAKDLNN